MTNQITVPLTVAIALAAGQASAVDIVFVHDQSADEIIRLVDRNGDGDATDPGEATVFLDDSLLVLRAQLEGVLFVFEKL